MSFFDDDPPAQPRPAPRSAPRRSRPLIATAVVLVVAFFLVSVFTGLWTDRLWFKSLGYSQVFGKVLGTRVLLFIVFGLLMGVFVAANIIVAYRFRPLFRPASHEQVSLDRYRDVVDPLRRWLLIGVAGVLALFAGTGTISQDGAVGPIGGIQQKIVAAADAGAKLFLVPPANCSSALGADVGKGEIELVKAPTMRSAIRSLEAYAKNKNADLPKCG